MTVTTKQTHSTNPVINPSQSFEELHFNLAQEISCTMAPVHAPTTSLTQKQIQAIGNHRTKSSLAPVQPHHFGSPPRKPKLTITKSSGPVRIQTRAPVAKPSPAEEELVRRIHRKVGGPAKLSTYDDPAKVRHVVIEALALEQSNPSDASRIRKGQLSVFERRVVRTVTNRGAAVRSRMRQRKEVAQLKNELRIRDTRVHHLENMIRSLCIKFATPLPEAFEGSGLFSEKDQEMSHLDADTEPETDSVESTEVRGAKVEGIDAPDFALDQEIFGTLVDQMITQPPW